MTSKLKEDEKNEKIIRGLLKKSGNRKCVNCNVLGPQYVCSTFSTFVCATCSGIHREFTHRVKSVSMAKFTPEEIASLQAGGNELAKGIFFKDLYRERVKAPDSSNVDKLRSFIKHAYVDRRYTGERSVDRPPTGKMGDREEINEKRRSDPYQSDRSSPGHDVRKSLGHAQDNQRKSHHGISPSPPGIVSNWRREDRFSNGKKSDDCRNSVEANKPEISSPDNQNDSTVSHLPTVLPVTDLLGENVKPLQISEISAADGSVITQTTASSSSLAESSVNPTEHKNEISLIDFDDSPEPVVTVAVTEVQQTVTGQSVVQSTSTPVDDDWGIFSSVQTPCITNQPVVPQLVSAFHSDSSSQRMAVAQAPQATLVVAPPAQTLEANSQGSRELPMDLFTATYSTTPYQGPAWQTGQLPGMGFPAQYNTAMSTPTFSQPIKQSNPFDPNRVASPSPAAAFPSMSSMHAALPYMAVHGGSAVPPHGSPAIQGAYMGQQLHSNMAASRPQGFVSYGNDGTHFSSLNPIPATPNPALGGNPFG